ncbi:unnamed protein product [Adineta ricciae]|uniref:Uncharacterized protein n=1 Tax=Adineta ricciae TaxID=249248 RepID=A0A814LMM8_ADIRI|nr:unnamed protein product [Adineta ricciae]
MSSMNVDLSEMICVPTMGMVWQVNKFKLNHRFSNRSSNKVHQFYRIHKVFAIAVVFFMFISVGSAEHESKHDNMCAFTRDTLCVKDTLVSIAAVARSVNRTANEIERNILFKYLETETLRRYINYEMSFVQSHLPTPQYHVKFFQLNNIDKHFLGDLLLEAHNALSYYYKSINAILDLKDVLSFTSDSWFGDIAHNLRYEMICSYRNVLSVYSRAWPSIDQVNEIRFSRRNYPSSPSMVHDVRAMIVVRLIRDWMSKVHRVLINMENKYYSVTTKVST